VNKLKILHIGAYNRNIGDNVAIYGARAMIAEHLNSEDIEAEWIPFDIAKYHDVPRTKEHIVLFNSMDVILVGGAGLVESSPINVSVGNMPKLYPSLLLLETTTPIFILGVGINDFRGKAHYDHSPFVRKDWNKAFKRATLSSIRDDGSQQIFERNLSLDFPAGSKNEILSKYSRTPDTALGCVLEPHTIKTIDELAIFGVQPAFNGSQWINVNRWGRNDGNIAFLSSIRAIKNIADLETTWVPHTPKDIRGYDLQGFNIDYNLSETVNSIQSLYRNVDFSVVMRGHGQILATMLNIPHICLITQDKNAGFSQTAGFEDYSVDTAVDKDWPLSLTKKVLQLKTDNNFLQTWYYKRNDYMSQATNQIEQFLTAVGRELTNIYESKYELGK